MSFQNFGDSFQGQQNPEEAGAPGAAGAQPQQQQMGQPMGQPMDAQPGQFQGAQGGAPGSAPPQQQGGDAKTTLWYVAIDLP